MITFDFLAVAALFRESRKRKKGKHKREKIEAKTLRGDDKVDADALEVVNRNTISIGTKQLAREKERAVQQVG